jgi:hypothetical protein
LWTGSANSKGLPTISRRVDGKAKTMSARRWVWMASGKPLAANEIVMVTCGSRTCLNPKHMRLSDRSAIQVEMNERDRSLPDRRGRAIRARWVEKGMGLKLTADQAVYARCSDLPSKQVAEELQVSVATVNHIRRGDAWKDYSNPFRGLIA